MRCSFHSTLRPLKYHRAFFSRGYAPFSNRHFEYPRRQAFAPVPKVSTSVRWIPSARDALFRILNTNTFFRYTGERWLWDEEQQFRDRYKVFNVVELQNSAAKATGSDSCVSMIKLAEGGYKVFRLLRNDGKDSPGTYPKPKRRASILHNRPRGSYNGIREFVAQVWIAHGNTYKQDRLA